MRRVCFTLQVDPSVVGEYRTRHERVWPEMLKALRDSGWHDYSLHIRDDGLLVGTLLTDDLSAAQDAMDATDVNARWQAGMAPFFTGIGGAAPDRGLTVLEEIFHLDTQLAAIGEDA